jgi:hypothetical protein
MGYNYLRHEWLEWGAELTIRVHKCDAFPNLGINADNVSRHNVDGGR